MNLLMTLALTYTVTFALAMHLLINLTHKHAAFYLSMLSVIFSYAGWLTATEASTEYMFYTGIGMMICCLLIAVISLLWWVRTLLTE